MEHFNIEKNYQKGLRTIGTSLDDWKTYLGFSSQLYKYSFVETVQIYEQFPTAEFVAEAEVWNKIERAVKAKESSIVVGSFNRLTSDLVVTNYFDITQTVGKDFVRPDWSASTAVKSKTLDSFFHQVFSSDVEIVDRTALMNDVVNYGMEVFISRDNSSILAKHQDFIEQSALFSIAQKAEWLGEVTQVGFDTMPQLSRRELEYVGQISNELSKSALQRVLKLKKAVELELKEEKENGIYTLPSHKQSGVRPAAERVRQDSSSLHRGQQPAVDAGSGRVGQFQGILSQEGGNSTGAGRKTGETGIGKKSLSERRLTSEGATLTNDSLTGEGNRHTRNDGILTNERPSNQSGYFQLVSGHFQHNPYLHFQWPEGSNPKVYLSSNLLNIKNDYPMFEGTSRWVDIEEHSTQDSLLKFKGKLIQTRSIEELYAAFQEVANGDNNLELEKALFFGLKKSPSRLSGQTISDGQLKWYRDYLDQMATDSQTIALFEKENSFNLTTSAVNPYLRLGVVSFVEDKLDILVIENDYHFDQSSIWTTEDTKQHKKLNSNWIVKVDDTIDFPFEYAGLSVLLIREKQEFEKILEDFGSKPTALSLRLEQEILHHTKNHLSHVLGTDVSTTEKEQMDTYLSLLSPYQDELSPFVQMQAKWESYLTEKGKSVLTEIEPLQPNKKGVLNVRGFEQFGQLEGSFPLHRNMTFNWHEGSPVVLLSNRFTAINFDRLEAIESSAVYTIIEDKEQSTLLRFKDINLVTRNATELYEQFSATARNEGTLEFEREVFLFTKENQRATVSGKLSSSDLHWYKDYLETLGIPDETLTDEKISEAIATDSQNHKKRDLLDVQEVVDQLSLESELGFLGEGQYGRQLDTNDSAYFLNLEILTDDGSSPEELEGTPNYWTLSLEDNLSSDRIGYIAFGEDWAESFPITEELERLNKAYQDGLPLTEVLFSSIELGISQTTHIEGETLANTEPVSPVEVEPSGQLDLFSFEEDSQEERPIKTTRPVTAVNDVKTNSHNFYLDSAATYANGKKAKATDNLAALTLLNSLSEENREATLSEQQILSKFSGWGGIPEIFDGQNTSWSTEYEALKGLLPEQDYVEARASVLTAFFTDAAIVRSMYEFTTKFGDFSHANILDPAMGTGNFFSYLPKKWRNANLLGVELEPVTGNIAKRLFPEATIQIQGFEKVDLKEKVDLVVGNIPFNNIKVLDKKYNKYNFVIHDYFMAKSIDSLQSNGVLAVITSAGSMDKKDSKLREYLARRATFVGGIRLPKTAFKQSAGTEVISDILVFQKKTPQEMIQNTVEPPSWTKSVEHPDYPGLFMNQYFLDHSEQILGTIAVKNFQGQTLDVLPFERELSEQLDEAFRRIEEWNQNEIKQLHIPKPTAEKKVLAVSMEKIVVPEDTPKYSFFVLENRAFYHTHDGEYEEYTRPVDVSKIKGMLAIKAATLDLLELQQQAYEDTAFEAALYRLNKSYDEFITKYGYLNQRQNKSLLSDDTKYPLLRSLEKETVDGFEKGAFFFEATVRPRQEVLEVDTAIEAIKHSMATRRRIDFNYIASIYPNHSPAEIISEAGDSIYLNPQKMIGFSQEPHEALHAWEIADEYLTGNVKEKLNTAIVLSQRMEKEETKKRLQLNIQALEANQPERLLPGDIKFQIGSSWIPPEIYSQFVYELLEIPRYKQPATYVDYLEYNSSYRIVGKPRTNGDVLAHETYGVEELSAFAIIETSLNLKQVAIYDRVKDGDSVKYVLNPERTMVARGKQEDIEAQFKKWLFADPVRSENLLAIYNDRFNTTIPRKYSGEDLVFDSMSKSIELRPHQKDVIARILYSGRALMAHEVGAGKTAAMLSSAMYMKEHGLINKALFVVPNHLTEQWGKEILTFYPNANILITTKKDFEKENRQAFVSRIATDDNDAIIIGHSQFERIPLSAQYQRDFLQRQLDDLTEVVGNLKAENSQNWSIKQIEKFRKSLSTQLEALNNDERRDNVINFEDLGVDFLYVDEAHVYKNLFTYTKMQNVAGIGKSRSQRATDMLMKVRYIQSEHEGGNVVFATGTPVSNSMSELYVMQYYLQPEALTARGLTSFDAWASTFGQVTSSLEITPESSGYRMRNRFSKFHNLPELMSMFREVADIQTAEMLNLPTPQLKNGKVETIVTERTDFQEKMMDEFVVRADDIRNGRVQPNEDNMLKLTHEARLMAIDPRLIDDSLPRDPESKLSICTEDVFSVWKRTEQQRSTQIIFCDVGTPKADEFNVYQEMKEQLTEKGVPSHEIAFIHDAKTDVQRDTLFEKVRNGDVRIIIGSTQKLGTGTNIQNKLIKAHHIDCPWKPSDLIQREGRILRQGNENEVIEISRYVTKGTFDSYLWQIQEQKLTYISQVMSSENINRSMDDLDEIVLTAAEVKAAATENPLLVKKMSIDNDVSRLQLVRNQWENSRARMDRNLREVYPNKLASLESRLSNYQNDLAVIDNYPAEPFEITINGNVFDSRSKAFDEVYAQSLLLSDQEIKDIGEYRGLIVQFYQNDSGDSHLILKGESSYRTTFNPNTESGNIVRLTNIPAHIERLKEESAEEILTTEKQVETAQKELEKPFSQQEELDDLLREQRKINQSLELESLKDKTTTSHSVEEIEIEM